MSICLYEYCFTSLSAQSWQFRDRMKPVAGNMPYSYFEWHQEFFTVHSTIIRTVHSMPLNSLQHCNHDDKYPARPGFEPGTSKSQAPVDTNEPWLWVYIMTHNLRTKYSSGYGPTYVNISTHTHRRRLEARSRDHILGLYYRLCSLIVDI